MSAAGTHKDHMPNSKKEKIGTVTFLISLTIFFCITSVYIFAYAIPESKAEKQNAEKIETQQREYLDDKFENSVFNMMYRGVLNEKIVLFKYCTLISNLSLSTKEATGKTITSLSP